ncbi:lipopolysaccharide heptosyltransferase I [Niveibacterium umoris]|uniref:Lipopolysaccharide heptosyltransferase 1 n=1 Tax=Niveibacterium umoris TaxID=1193620 RepID=A0A840BKC6_9RHOO|nr:lipopolysaccharide heptosyltransferase I [Niveibacterium umoris]MBB4012874.1 heptosyltransferase-1 [Niveibacterium umoris]
MREILIVKTSSMGDVIQYLPAVTDLHARVPDLAVDWVVEAPFAPLARLHPGVRRVIPVALRSWRKRLLSLSTWREFGTFRDTLKLARYEKVIDAQGLLKSALLARMAGAPVAGYMPDSAREPFATRFYANKYRVSWQMHAVERNRRLTAAVFDYRLDLPLDYGIRAPDPAEDAWRPEEPYSVLLTATSRDEKLWPEPNWIELGRALNRRGLHCVLPAGSDAERTRATRIAAALPHATVAPRMPLDALATLLERAQCVVGVDTGLSHLAAALKVPVVAIYIATEPGANGVAGGRNAINLGGKGQCPGVAQVLQSLAPWVA